MEDELRFTFRCYMLEQGSGGLARSMSGGQQHEDAHPACIEAMDYSSSMRMLAVVFTDGRCALSSLARLPALSPNVT